MKSLRFKKLWLVSEITRAAKKIEFEMNTLLIGKNHTGKSTIVKNIFRAFGCETKGKSDRWDRFAITALTFEINQKEYTIYRKANVFAIRDETDASTLITQSYSQWANIIAELFDFRLMLSDHQGKTKQATPPYLFLPFYMDQDGSWLKQWNSFDKLTQFAGWLKPTISYVTGQQPNEYYIAKFEEARFKVLENDAFQELRVVSSALNRVRESFPSIELSIDIDVFKTEIEDLTEKSTYLRREQESLRKKVFELSSAKESLDKQRLLAWSALKEIEGDLKYLTDPKTTSTLSCPVCGSEHENHFEVRLAVIDDAETVRTVIHELDEEYLKVERELSETSIAITKIHEISSEVEKSLTLKKGDVRLQDIIDSKSIDTVNIVFQDDIESLNKAVNEHTQSMIDAGAKAAKFNEPNRKKAINAIYAENIELFSSELDAYDLSDAVKSKPDASINASGSGLPRSFLAYFFSVLYTSNEKGDAKKFPIVIDSPNQQGQDPEHLLKMLEFIKDRAPKDQQLILAVEYVPEGFVFEGKYEVLKKPFELLDNTLYADAVSELKDIANDVDVGIGKLVNSELKEIKVRSGRSLD